MSERHDISGRPQANRPAPLVVFDLDGTLVDTAPDLAASLNHCLSAVGLSPVRVEFVRPHAGHGVRVMLQRAYEDAGADLPDAVLADQTGRFLAYYQSHIADHSVLFPGALAAIDELATEGFTLAVCTNKTEALARTLLHELAISDRFAAICGSDTFSQRKPDPVHLLGTIERAGGTPASSVMVGDAQVDIDAASAAGLPSILVGFGYGADDMARGTATHVITSFDYLKPAFVRAVLAQRSSVG